MAFDTLIDFAYGMLVDGLDAESREYVDQQLAEADKKLEPEPEKTVPVTKTDGTVVYVSPERWQQLMSNRRAMRGV